MYARNETAIRDEVLSPFFGPDAIVPSKTRLATGHFIKILPIVGVSLDIPKTDHNRPI